MEQAEEVPPDVYQKYGTVVVRAGGRLPPFCVKCGEPAAEDSPVRKLAVFPLPLWVGLLIMLVPYVGFIGFCVVLVSFLTRREVKVALPLCNHHVDKYETARPLGMTLAIGSPIVLVVLGILRAPLVLFYADFGLIALAVYLLRSVQGVWATKIESQFCAFKGAGERFLAHLPPYERGTGQRR